MTSPIDPSDVDPQTKQATRKVKRAAKLILISTFVRVIVECAILFACSYAWEYAVFTVVVAFAILEHLAEQHDADWLRQVEDGVLWPAVAVAALVNLGTPAGLILIATVALVARFGVHKWLDHRETVAIKSLVDDVRDNY